MFLTDHQMRVMTGYKQHAAQIQWLTDNDFRFVIRNDGRPNVLIRHVEEKFSDRQEEGIAIHANVSSSSSMLCR